MSKVQSPMSAGVPDIGLWTLDFFGRDAEIRTRDLTHPKGARYQAAPRPVKPSLVSTQPKSNANGEFERQERANQQFA